MAMELSTTALQSSHGIPSVSLSDRYEYIVAIDIGTIYSGFAFANKEEINFATGQFHIHSNQAWNSGNPNLISLKTATCILLSKDLELVSFGYKAEKKFCEIVEDKKTHAFYCFRRFKMALYDKTPTLDMLIKDETEKEIPAKVVFSKSIYALKKTFLEQITAQGINVPESEIRWVVTVPAIWSDAAKQFMRVCSNEAGIPYNQLILALEPEAASIYCQFVRSREVTDAKLTVSKPGTQYIVVDLGGGTVDVTVHEILGNGYLKEIDAARGEDCGGNSINESLVLELIRTFGGPLINEIRKEHPSVYLDVHREFEAAKKDVNPDSKDQLSLRLPQAFLNFLFRDKTGESFSETIKDSPHAEGVSITYEGVKIDSQMIKSKLFNPTVDRILNLLNKIIQRVNSPKLSKILLVGGLSDSKFIQKSIRNEFPDKQVIVPEDAGLCVVKGAVLFGKDPKLISNRVVRYTYGIKVIEVFQSSIHDPSKKCIVDGTYQCKDIFMVFVKIGTVVEMNQKVKRKVYTSHKFQTILNLALYTSSQDEPKYVDGQDCELIGYLNVTIPTPTEKQSPYEVTLVFGNTELRIHAKDISSGKECETSLNFVNF